jgi:metallo-beta-lactamase family protein
MNGHTTTDAGLAVTFWGAAQAVTGSMHLVEAARQTILLDCGLVRDAPTHYQPPDERFPRPPGDIAAAVISHAHIDHCGQLPALVRQGFTGPVYCTPETLDLLELVLANSARIQAEEASTRHIIGRSDRADTRPLCSQQDVHQTLRQCVAVPHDQPHEIAPGVRLRLLNSGHILGAAITVLTVSADGAKHTLVFTGDLGRRGSPIGGGPVPLPAADLLVCECTNGDRRLASLDETAAAFEALVQRTVERGGKVLLPAFTLGRTQLVLHYLCEGMRSGRMPAVPIFVDSPMAGDIAEVYHRHAGPAAAALADELQGPMVHYLRSMEESNALANRRQSCVIIAPGGMCEGGRIVRHLKNNIDDPRCSVALVGYQAPHTLGHRLFKPGPTIRIHGRTWNRWADVVELRGFTGHPDQTELLALLEPLAELKPAVRLVHGEPDAAATFAAALRQRGFDDVAIPGRGETVRVG